MESTHPHVAAPARRRVAFVLYVTVFIEGLMLAVPGPTLDALSDNAGSTIGEIGVIFTANGLGFVLGALIAGRLYEKFDGNRLLTASLLVMAGAAVFVPNAGSLGILLVLFVVTGAAIGMIDVGANTLLVWEFGEKVPPFMNALHLAWGVGAFAAPLIVALLSELDADVSSAYPLFAVAMVPVAIWLTTTPVTEIPAAAGSGKSPEVWRRHSTLIILISFLFFLHVGAELSFGGWVFSYASESGLGAETTARVLNAVFWGGLVVGRVIAIPVSLRLSARSMIWLDLLGAGLALAVVAFLGQSPLAIWGGVGLFGASIGSIFASCINFAGTKMPITSRVTSAFLIGGSLGSMSLPWLTGVLFGRVGPETLPYIVGAMIATALVLFAAITRHASSPAS
jgi:fucose permease